MGSLVLPPRVLKLMGPDFGSTSFSRSLQSRDGRKFGFGWVSLALVGPGVWFGRALASSVAVRRIQPMVGARAEIKVGMRRLCVGDRPRT